MDTFNCCNCSRILPVSNSGGYATLPDDPDKKLCYDCLALSDIQTMRETGKIVLYLVNEKIVKDDPSPDAWKHWFVTNFPGTLKIQTTQSPNVSKHNIAGKRYDVWFIGPDGDKWHGYNLGDNHICRCNRIKKQKWKPITRMTKFYLKPYNYAQ